MGNEREKIEFDILFVGGGPANLAASIHLMNLARKKDMELEVAIIEKGATIGSHSLSGAILDPIALREIIPNYLESGCPVEMDVQEDEFYFLTKNKSFKVPFTPKYMHNKGYHIISLSKFTAWLASIAEELGVNIFPGFAGTEVLYGEDDKTIVGVRTGDKGIDKDNNRKTNYEPGIDIIAKVTVFGEGPRGSLLKKIDKKLNIFHGRMPQVFETAVKEVIELPESNYFSDSSGKIVHTFGYPLGLNTKGGSFIYQMKERRISIGLIVGLDYSDPMLEPYKEFILFKRHPFISGIINGGRVLQQGAKTLCAGGYYTMPELAVDGALFVGDSASMLNIQRLKGIHTAMKSGILAAEAIMEALIKDNFTRETLGLYKQLFEESWVRKELYAARNFTQALSKRGISKFFHLGVQYFTNGRGIIDPLPIKEDNKMLKEIVSNDLSIPDEQVSRYGKLEYDDKLYLDKLTGVYLSQTQHEEDQPCHLIVHDPELCSNECSEKYRNPCTRFCPASVYEIEVDEETKKRRLILNPSNCLHCKTCDIKDPYGNITWTCPEGGGGPGYTLV
nr:electron transfer flavoprotein-ubiquinone oxidoreductase [Desulfobacterales bacterium]